MTFKVGDRVTASDVDGLNDDLRGVQAVVTKVYEENNLTYVNVRLDGEDHDSVALYPEELVHV